MPRQPIPDIGSKIYANIVRPGMIIKTADGKQIAVEHVNEGYNTITFDDGSGRKTTVGFADKVEVLGYFNAESTERATYGENAYPDGSHRIKNCDDIRREARSAGSDPTLRAHIIRQAVRLGCVDDIPDDWRMSFGGR